MIKEKTKNSLIAASLLFVISAAAEATAQNDEWLPVEWESGIGYYISVVDSGHSSGLTIISNPDNNCRLEFSITEIAAGHQWGEQVIRDIQTEWWVDEGERFSTTSTITLVETYEKGQPVTLYRTSSYPADKLLKNMESGDSLHGRLNSSGGWGPAASHSLIQFSSRLQELREVCAAQL